MSIKYYIHENPFKKGKAFFARTIINQKIKEKKLLEYMSMKGTSLTSNELQAILNLFKESIEDLLAEGNMIQLDNFMNLYPAITASFDSPKGAFNHNRDKVKIRCRINKDLVKTVRNKSQVEKQADDERQPNLTHVISGIQKENVIRWPYSTTLRGSNLNPSNRGINSISIFNQENTEEILNIPASHLLLDTKGPKELSFSILSEVEIPSWLTPGLPVYLRVEYAGDNLQLNRLSTEVKTFWQTLPESEQISTEETETEEYTA